MSYRLRIHLAAEVDVAEAAQWYNERQLGLGEKFIREVDEAIVRILDNTLAFPIILRRHEVRRVLVLTITRAIDARHGITSQSFQKTPPS
jgi:hypothetical protein